MRARHARMQQQERQRGHAAHRVADHAGEALDAEAAHDVRGGVGAVLDATGPGSRGDRAAPVAGSIDAGPVEPLQLPSEFTQITNQRSLSIGLPGPSIASHQPGFRIACVAGGVRVGRQAGDDQHGVVARGVERAPGFVGDARAVQRAAALHRERRGQVEDSVPGGMNSVMGSDAVDDELQRARGRAPVVTASRSIAQTRSCPTVARSRRGFDSPRLRDRVAADDTRASTSTCSGELQRRHRAVAVVERRPSSGKSCAGSFSTATGIGGPSAGARTRTARRRGELRAQRRRESTSTASLTAARRPCGRGWRTSRPLRAADRALRASAAGRPRARAASICSRTARGRVGIRRQLREQRLPRLRPLRPCCSACAGRCRGTSGRAGASGCAASARSQQRDAPRRRSGGRRRGERARFGGFDQQRRDRPAAARRALRERVARLGEALLRRVGAAEQPPAFDVVGIFGRRAASSSSRLRARVRRFGATASSGSSARGAPTLRYTNAAAAMRERQPSTSATARAGRSCRAPASAARFAAYSARSARPRARRRARRARVARAAAAHSGRRTSASATSAHRAGARTRTATSWQSSLAGGFGGQRARAAGARCARRRRPATSSSSAGPNHSSQVVGFDRRPVQHELAVALRPGSRLISRVALALRISSSTSRRRSWRSARWSRPATGSGTSRSAARSTSAWKRSSSARSRNGSGAIASARRLREREQREQPATQAAASAAASRGLRPAPMRLRCCGSSSLCDDLRRVSGPTCFQRIDAAARRPGRFPARRRCPSRSRCGRRSRQITSYGLPNCSSQRSASACSSFQLKPTTRTRLRFGEARSAPDARRGSPGTSCPRR